MVEQGKAIEIESVLKENRSFPPSEAFVKQANLGPEEYRQMLEKAEADTTGFWEDRARELDWFSGWEKALEWNPPFAKWFVGGKINASYNCLDRHLKSGKGDKTAIIWEGEPGEVRKLSYREVYEEVCRLSNALKKIGVEKGDRIAMYMPLVPELAISMLAAARIGATHTVIFGGFSAEAIRDRVNDCGCKVIITADGGYRRGTEINLKKTVDEALEDAPSIEHVIVLKRTGSTVEIKPSRDYWWHEIIGREKAEFEPESLDSEHPLFVLYTSG
ncbi:MAG TPA: AMP-binding protein, partial [Pyrinomonadaceae bacterium]|nr:AMP-binding protein [Pyrinomonadaceae bacterium]